MTSPEPPDTRLVLVEGLPGSGKTSTARHLARWLRARGRAAQWYLEESHDHPVLDREAKRQNRRDDFAEICLECWRAFTARARPLPDVSVVEGTMFQSTVRFMVEHERPLAEIRDYFARFEERVAALEPRVVYLVQDDPASFMRERTLERRSPEWTRKVSSYETSTACARARGWEGVEGMVQFWLHYRGVCDDLIERARLPVLRLDNGGQRWGELHWQIRSWLAEALGVAA